LSAFAEGNKFDNARAFERLYEQVPEEAKRELILAIARNGKDRWFYARRRDAAALGPWLRRAFLAGASCMREDAKMAFFKTEQRTGDILEQAVLSWAKEHPLG
jgi:hypothetical protein